MCSARRSVALALALAGLLLGSAGAAQADDAAWKAAHDTDPHLPLTPQQVQMTAQKRAAEAEFPAVLAGPFSTCGASCGGGGYPSSATLVANQTPQSTGYYCGPAAVHEALGAVGVSMTQAAAATALHTTTAGTAWSGGGTSPSGYPVPDVLNAKQSQNYYIPQPVASPPPANATATYKDDLQWNIYVMEAPLVGDAWETPSSSHRLVGHPGDRTIFHWFEIRGYSNSAGSTKYEDSVHNAASVSWHAGVPAYSTIPSSWIVSIVSGRGYVW